MRFRKSTSDQVGHVSVQQETLAVCRTARERIRVGIGGTAIPRTSAILKHLLGVTAEVGAGGSLRG